MEREREKNANIHIHASARQQNERNWIRVDAIIQYMTLYTAELNRSTYKVLFFTFSSCTLFSIIILDWNWNWSWSTKHTKQILHDEYIYELLHSYTLTNKHTPRNVWHKHKHVHRMLPHQFSDDQKIQLKMHLLVSFSVLHPLFLSSFRSFFSTSMSYSVKV